MKILSAVQIRQLDQHTIENEPVSSIDLMERAARTFVKWFTEHFRDTDQPVFIFCGPGNNGGDGLAVARILLRAFYEPFVVILEIPGSKSPDFQQNLERLSDFSGLDSVIIHTDDPFPIVPDNAVIIDAFFGAGLNRPIADYWATFVEQMSNSGCTRIAIDIPSGLFADKHSSGIAFQADYTFSFELPKLAFMFPENESAVGQWVSRSIGLSSDFIGQMDSPYAFVTKKMVCSRLKKRAKFSHKGTFGHALLICGSTGMMGAALLAARACLRTGVGLLHVHVPQDNGQLIQIALPEAMLSLDKDHHYFAQAPDLAGYTAVGIGCGLGKKKKTGKALSKLLNKTGRPLVLDADGLNLVAKHNLSGLLPPNSILTPHPKEFERLFGKSADDFARMETQRKMANKLGVFIILKTAHTAIATPGGKVFFNSTGNPGMATAGSGDVLTGMLTSLLAQGYSPESACLIGVFLHGMAGDIAAGKKSQPAMLAGDIVEAIGDSFLTLEQLFD